MDLAQGLASTHSLASRAAPHEAHSRVDLVVDPQASAP